MTEHIPLTKRASSTARAAIPPAATITLMTLLPAARLALLTVSLLALTPAFAAHRRAAWRYPLRSPARGVAGAAPIAARLLGVCGHPVAGALAFSSDGKRLAVGSGSALSSTSPGEVRIWEVASGRILYTVPYMAPVRAVAYSPLADNLAVSTVQSQVTLWSPATGTPLRTLAFPHSAGGQCLAFSPAGDVLATGGGDLAGRQFPGEARLWSVHGGDALRTVSHSGRTVVSVQFSPQRGDCLVASRGLGADSAGSVEVWDRTLRTRRWSRPASDLVGAAIVDQGLAVAGLQSEPFGGQFRLRVRLWSGKSGAPLNSYVLPMGGWAISPDGRRIACAGDDRKSVTVRDARTGRFRQKLRCDYAPAGLTFAFSPDGRLLAAGTQDGAVILWALK